MLFSSVENIYSDLYCWSGLYERSDRFARADIDYSAQIKHIKEKNPKLLCSLALRMFLNSQMQLHSHRLKCNPDSISRLSCEIQLLKPDDLTCAVFHQHDLFTCLFHDIFIGGIAKPDSKCISFSVIIDFYFDKLFHILF